MADPVAVNDERFSPIQDNPLDGVLQIALLPAKFALQVLYNVGRLHIIAEDGYYVHQVAETRLKIASADRG